MISYDARMILFIYLLSEIRLLLTLFIYPPYNDIAAWADGSVCGGLGKGRAGIHIDCTKCLTAALSLSWPDAGLLFIPLRLNLDLLRF